MRRIIYFILLTSLAFSINAQFTDIGQSLVGLSEGVPCWGDFDGDGDLDLHISGYNGSNNWRMYKNNEGTFSLTAANVFPARYSYSSLCDWDNDGDLDGITSGWGSSIRTYTWRNNGDDTFTNTQTLSNINSGSSAWADYDNDGDEDLLLNGWNGSAVTSLVYRNDNGIFTNINAGLQGVQYSASSWCDWDGDGDFDILYTGHTGSANFIGSYRNDNGTFTYTDLGITPVRIGSVCWADYDADGDPDLLITGYTGTGGFTEIYVNDRGTFTSASAGLPGLYWSSGEWGDFDNDGDYDVLLTGTTDGSYKATYYIINDSGTFTSVYALPGVWKGAAKWGDYDYDGDLDIVVMGESSTGYITRIFRNDYGYQNHRPTKPSNLTLSENSGKLVFSFDEAFDTPDPVISLTYNIQTDSLGIKGNVKTAHANQTGILSIPSAGNLGYKLSWQYKELFLPQEAVYADWKVQAVDLGFSGSAFESFSGTYHFSDLQLASNSIITLDDSLHIENSYTDSIQNYTIQIDADPYFDSYFEDTVTSSSFPISDLSFTGSLESEVTYYWRIRPNYTNPDRSSDFSQTPSTFVFHTEFTEINSGMTGLAFGSSFWGDYDNDGDLDILVTGQDETLQNYSLIYRNDGSDTFTDINAGLDGVNYSYADWGDYDNDGDLDIVLMGSHPLSTLFIYRNDAGSFTGISTGIGCNGYGTVKWGDKDNDGDLDLLVTGQDGASNEMSKIYENNGGIFTESNIGELYPLEWSCGDWADFDNDGDLDILISGRRDTEYWTLIYENNAGSYTESGSFEGLYRSSVCTGDYNNDGYIDAVVCGYNAPAIYKTMFLTNYSGSLAYDMDLPGVQDGSLDLGDFDNDGDPDLLISGNTGSDMITKIYLNSSGNFADSGIEFTGSNRGRASWGDYDGDGDLDILVNGRDGSSTRFTKVYRNNLQTANTVPSAPSNLSATAYSNHITYQFSAGSDTETPAAGLYYNMNIEINDDYVKPAMADLATGRLKLPVKGNLNKVTAYDLKREIYPQESVQSIMKVQTVDAGYAGSQFASMATTLFGPDLELVCEPNMYMNDSLSWSAAYSDSILNYTIQVCEISDFSWGVHEQTVDKSKYPKADYITKALDEFSFAGDLRKGVTNYWRIRPNYSDFRASRYSGNISSFSIYPMFSRIEAGLNVYEISECSWGDYDNDGDLDMAIHFQDSLRIMMNSSGYFSWSFSTQIYIPYKTGVKYLSCRDFNNDGFCDVAAATNHEIFLLINDSGSFSEDNITTYYIDTVGPIEMCDIDNDGDNDLIYCDYENINVRFYDDGLFSEPLFICGIYGSPSDPIIRTVDFENDGDLDLIINSWFPDTGDYEIKVFLNNDGVFSDAGLDIPGDYPGYYDLGDYDNDGDMDILISGYSSARILRNDISTFTDVGVNLKSTTYGDLKWIDIDNDGDLDIIITGITTFPIYETIVYRNDGGVFINVDSDISNYKYSTIKPADFDNDGDIDLFISGESDSVHTYTALYRNNSQYSNTPPLPPSGVSLTATENGMAVCFSPGSDNETPAPGLSYNIEIGVNEYIGKSSMSDLSTGYKKTVGNGNIGQVNSWTLNKELPDVFIPQEIIMIWCKVQSVDNCFAGSAFAERDTFMVSRDLQILPKQYMTGTDELVWEFVESDSVASYTVMIVDEDLIGHLETLFFSKENKTGYVGVQLQDLDMYSFLNDDQKYYWWVKPDHVNPSKFTNFNSEPNSFIFNPSLVPPGNITITVDGQYIVLDWSGVKADKAEPDYYTVYSSNDPYAEFPSGWTEETSTSNMSCILISSTAKKFYCVTASNFATKKIIKTEKETR